MPEESTSYDYKKIILFGLIILIIAGIIGFLVYKKYQTNNPDQTNPNLFPYDGTVTPGQTTGDNQSITSTESNPITENQLDSTTSDRLRQITNYPITGMYAFVQNKVVSEAKNDELNKRIVYTPKTIPVDYVRFNAKQNGFLVDAEVTKNIITIKQKTSTPIPTAEEIWFSNEGNSITYRTWNPLKQTISSFNGTIPGVKPLTYCQIPLSTILKTGSKGDEVSSLQKYVNAKLSSNLIVDGVYGGKLAAAIKPLQKLLGVSETGVYDQVLIDAINSDCSEITTSWQGEQGGLKKLSGDFLDDGILRGTVSPNGDLIFFLKKTTNGVAGIVSASNGTNQRRIFNSPLTEWSPQWVNETTIAMTTLASSEADGFLYFLNPSTGNFRKVLGPITGLTTLVNPSGTQVIYSESLDGGLQLVSYSIQTGEKIVLDLSTLPSKCIWKNDTEIICGIPNNINKGQYPDDWYQGNIAFIDSLWLINTLQNSTEQLVAPTQPLDMSTFVLSPTANYLYFKNKTDGTLWSYRLSEE